MMPGGGPGGFMGGPGGPMGGPGGFSRGGEDRGGGPSGFTRGGGDRGGSSGGGGDRSGGRDRGGRGFTPPGEGGESAEDRFARFEGMLRGFDANRDGVIDPKEVPEDRRRFLGFIGERMGVDFSRPVAIAKLREKASEQFGGGKKKEPEPLVPGFGVPQEATAILAFGERPPEPTSSGRSTSARGGSDDEQNARAQGFAEMMMRRYDRDGNGVLERDKGEWEGVRGDPNEIDRNHDGRIDRDEMVSRVAAYMGGNRGGDRGGDQGGDRGGGRGGDGRDDRGDQGENSQTVKKSSRFLSPTERLPEGLPDWFESRDSNKDGQVTMAEFSSSWTDSEAHRYLSYDLNDDGVITPDECLAAAKQPGFDAKGPPSSGPPAPGPPSSGPPSEGGEPSPAGVAKPEEKKPASDDVPWWRR